MYAGNVSRLESIVENLKLLPPVKLEMAADYIGRLQRIERDERHVVLTRIRGSLSDEVAVEIEKEIEDSCERIDERDW